MFEDTKTKITATIEAYKRVYHDEYSAFVKGQKVKLDNLQNKFAEMKGTDVELRGLLEVPVTLDNLIKRQLSSDEWDFYNSKAGKLWLAKTHQEFKMAEKL